MAGDALGGMATPMPAQAGVPCRVRHVCPRCWVPHVSAFDQGSLSLPWAALLGASLARQSTTKAVVADRHVRRLMEFVRGHVVRGRQAQRPKLVKVNACRTQSCVVPCMVSASGDGDMLPLAESTCTAVRHLALAEQQRQWPRAMVRGVTKTVSFHGACGTHTPR